MKPQIIVCGLGRTGYLTMPAMRLQQVWQNTSLTIPQSFPDLK
ncbi:hypothetical protein [Microcystis sp. LSC13-02]|nr:hypothetical protein [Microcystis sp. LSC13-02]